MTTAPLTAPATPSPATRALWAPPSDDARAAAHAAQERARAVEQDRERRDADCLACFLALVMAALVTLALALTTELAGMALALPALAGAVVTGVTVHAVARPAAD